MVIFESKDPTILISMENSITIHWILNKSSKFVTFIEISNLAQYTQSNTEYVRSRSIKKKISFTVVVNADLSDYPNVFAFDTIVNVLYIMNVPYIMPILCLTFEDTFHSGALACCNKYQFSAFNGAFGDSQSLFSRHVGHQGITLPEHFYFASCAIDHFNFLHSACINVPTTHRQMRQVRHDTYAVGLCNFSGGYHAMHGDSDYFQSYYGYIVFFFAHKTQPGSRLRTHYFTRSPDDDVGRNLLPTSNFCRLEM